MDPSNVPIAANRTLADAKRRTKKQRVFLRIARLVHHDVMDAHTPNSGYVWLLIDRLLRRAKADRTDL